MSRPRHAPAAAARSLPWEAPAGLAIGGLAALGFAAHLLPAGLAGVAWRLSCLAYAAICLIRGADRRRAAAMLALYLPFLAGAAAGAVVRPGLEGAADLARQGFIFAFAAIVYAAANDPVARRIGVWALYTVALAILADALVRALPALSPGWSYSAARLLKGRSFQGGFNANEVCYAALVALVAALREPLAPRWITLSVMALAGLCSLVLAARAPLPAVLAGMAGGWAIARAPLWAACARRAWLGPAAAALVTGAVLAAFVSQLGAIAHSALAGELAGRAALWQIAWGAWPQQPLFGFGPGSFQAVIHANLGKAHFSAPDEFTSLYQLQAGGFHNVWLSVLVERGAVGLAGMFASWCLLAGFALRHGGALPRAGRFVLSALLISLFLRGQVELAGLFDDADGPLDQIVMMALGLCLPPPARAGSHVARRGGVRARDLTARAAAARR